MKIKKRFFDWTVFKKTLCRFWPLWAAYSVLWLILMPLNGLMMMRLDEGSGTAGRGYMRNFALGNVFSQAEGPALALAAVFGVLCAMAVFSHLYNARSANLFGSLPVTREGLFLTHYLAGLAFMLVPNAAIFLLTLLVEAAGGYVCLQGLVFWLAASCGECFFFYSLAVFCAMFTGHILALPAFYGILNVLAYGITGLFYTVLDNFYYGFAGFGGGVQDDVARWLTPILRLRQDVGSYRVADRELPVPQGLGTLGAYALAAAVLAVCAFFLYRARRLESAGDVVSVKPMRPVFKYGMAFCVGMVFGMGTQWVLGGGELELAAAILIWGVIGYFAAQMLLDKSFKVLGRWKGAAAVAGVFIALFLVVGFDLTGYETRIPSAADVSWVHVRGLEVVRFRDDGDMVALSFDDPDQIELLTVLHRAAVEDRSERWHDGDLGLAGASLRLDYMLKNGSTLSRDYYVTIDPAQVDQEGTAAWAMEKLYHDTDLCWRCYELDRLEDAASRYRLDSVEFMHYSGVEDGWNGVSGVVAYGNDARALLDAVEEDLRAGRIGVRSLTDGPFYLYMPIDALQFRVTEPESGRIIHSVKIALQDTATSTLAELKRLEGNLDDPELREALGDWLKAQ